MGPNFLGNWAVPKDMNCVLYARITPGTNWTIKTLPQKKDIIICKSRIPCKPQENSDFWESNRG